MMVMLDIQDRDFLNALREYQQYTHKSIATVLNRQMRSVAMDGQEIAVESKDNRIAAIASQSWWPKYIAKILSSRTVAKARKRFWKSKGRSMTKLSQESHYSPEDAKEFSDKLIAKRQRDISFVRFFFWKMAAGVSPYVRGGGSLRRTSKAHPSKGFEVIVHQATEQKPEITAAVKYDSKIEMAVDKLNNLLNTALKFAVIRKADDIRKWIMDDQAKAYQQFSGRK